MNKKREYSLAEIFYVLARRLWIIVICIVIGTVGAFLLSKYVMSEVYTTSLSMYVAPNQGDIDKVVSINDLDYAQQVANTYVEILKTNAFLTDVIVQSGLDYSVKDLKSMVNIKIIENTEIFTVKVNSNNARDSLIIAETISLLAPQKINEIVEVSTIKVVDPAVLPLKPSAPNIMINTIIGLILGVILSIMIIFISDISENRIKYERD